MSETIKSKAEESPSAAPSGLARFVPGLVWLAHYQKAWLRSDILAGLTVTALLITEGMAYAELAGMPPVTAFYAAPVGLVLYALFGTSRQLVVAVSATISTMSFAAVSGLAAPQSAEFVILTSLLALIVGLVSVVAGWLNLGRIAQFFSESVLTGFVFGLALTIAVKQVPKIFGFSGGEGNFIERVVHLITHLPQTHFITLFIGVTSIGLMLLVEHRFHRIPAALVTVVYGILMVTFFNLHAHGVHIVGEIPAGFAPPKWPAAPLSAWLALLPAAFGMALVGFAEAYGPARSFAAKHKYKVSASQELIGQGLANVGAGLFQGFPIGASLSKSAANDAAGARTPLALIVAAGLTLLVALFFTPLFYNLPEATLAAIVVVAVAGMFKVKQTKRLYHLRRLDFALAMVALLGVLVFEVLPGLLIAVILSLFMLVQRASRPQVSVLGRHPERLEFADIQQNPGYETIPGLLLVRLDQGLFFANAALLNEAILALVDRSDPRPRTVALDLELTAELDVPALDALEELHETLLRQGIQLVLSRVHAPGQVLLTRSGLREQIGAQNIHPNLHQTVLKFIGASANLPVELSLMVKTFAQLEGMLQFMANQMEDGDKARAEQMAQQLVRLKDDLEQLETRYAP